MSGLEFVAVLGIAASAIEVVSACTKIIGRIKRYGHSVAFEDLKTQLQLFSKEIGHLSDPAYNFDVEPMTQAILGEVLIGCRRQLEKLDTILQSVTPASNSSKLRRTIYGIRSVPKEKEVREILSILSAYQAAILMHLSRRNVQNTAQIPRLISLLEDRILSEETRPLKPSMDQIIDTSTSQTTAMAIQQPPRPGTLQRLKRAPKCTHGVCGCQCHLSRTGISWNWLALSLVRFNTCDCDNKEYSMALQVFRHFCVLNFSMNWYDGVSIACSLQCHGVLKYTSPGFMVLYKCERGLMSLPQAREELRAMLKNGEINLKEVDPLGKGWVEKLLNRPWEPQRLDVQFGLLDEIFLESTTVPTDKIFLQFMQWMGLGPHLHLLERLLVLGLDPSDAGCELFPNWPTSHSLPSRIDDPFYIKAMAKFVRYDLEFGSTQPLQRAVLTNDFAEVKSLSGCKKSSIFLERNFQSQTALHLAILNPSILVYLIENGFSHSIDFPDRNGATPLMYAITYDQSESAMILLNCGADISLIGQVDGWSFFAQLIFRGNFSFLQKVIDNYRERKGTKWAQEVLDTCLWDYLTQDTLQWTFFKSEGLQFLLQASGNRTMTSKEGNTLLHLARDPTQANIMLSHTGLPINHPNFRGHTPLMLFSRFYDPLLVQRTIFAGASINAVDKSSLNALHHVIRNLKEWYWLYDKSHIWRRAVSTIAVLLVAGIDEVNCDSCVCSCSAAGCTPTKLFFHLRSQFDRYGESLSAISWQMEWYLMLKHLRGSETIHQIVQALFRYQKFEELGMTHTCCFSKVRYLYPIEDEYIPWKDEDKCAEDELTAIETAEDAREINEEQMELRQLLEVACSEFGLQPSFSDNESWISIVARRAVFIEEANEKLIKRLGSATPEKIALEEFKTQDGIEIISEEPFCYADHVSDNIHMADRHIMPTVSESDCALESHLQGFLTAVELYPLYEGSILPETCNRSSWDKDRKRLVRLLLVEAERVRQSPSESRDWDFDSLRPFFA